jgi:H+/Cl- antiporter ClcA
MFKTSIKWALLSIIVGLLAGITAYSFYQSINWAIDYRKSHQWIVIFLPISGLMVAWFYERHGQEVEGGSNLILDEIHEPQKHIPFRIVPMIFCSTILSHLFGASVGREGAAVQIGAGISDQFSKFMGHYFNNRRIVLMIGMSAGFSAIFGTPIAGAIFGIEILYLGLASLEAFFPCLLASLVGHYVASYLGLGYTKYTTISIPTFSLTNMLLVIVSAICFGIVARFFIWLLHFAKDLFNKYCSLPILRPFIGGVLIAIIFYFIGTDRYLGIGEEVIKATFIQQVYPWDFAAKILMTSLSLGAGFKGGEVMSLFYIGATLGNALSFIIPLSFSLLTALGFISVFSGASKAPLTSLALGITLFGGGIFIYAGIAVVVSYLVSGPIGIYKGERHFFKKFTNNIRAKL